jgi:hypothetical protein
MTSAAAWELDGPKPSDAPESVESDFDADDAGPRWIRKKEGTLESITSGLAGVGRKGRRGGKRKGMEVRQAVKLAY